MSRVRVPVYVLMYWRPPRSTRTSILLPYSTPFLALPRPVEQILRPRGQHPSPVRDGNQCRAKGRLRRRIIKADAPVAHDPPPGLTNLELDDKPRIPRHRRKGDSDSLQIPHRP